MTILTDRVAPKPPPENPEAEASLLGAVLLDGHLYEEVQRRKIAPADLSRETHKLVLAAIDRVAARGDAIAFQSVHAEMAAAGDLDAVGGAQFLVGLMQGVPTVAHAETYATIVERTTLLRRLIRAANDIARLALTRDDAQAAVDEAQALLFAVNETSLHRDIVALDVALQRYADQITQRGDDQHVGVPTGLASLDAKTGGLQPSDLILLAGRPGLGKTSLALCFVEHASVVMGKTCAVFSMEMSELQLVQRLISMTAEIDGNRIRRGRLSQDEFQAISHASSRLQQAPIFVEESSRLSVTDILAKSRRLQAERGLDLIIIDYLQLIEGVGNDENRNQEVAKISRALKSIARELEVPVIALSQLSRQIETRGTEPMLSDLRECVTGDTRVLDADSNEWREVRSLRAGTRVMSMSADQAFRGFEVADVWSTGVKPVYRVRSAAGHVIRATANHPFLTARGWLPLGDLTIGEVVATASMELRDALVERARDRHEARVGAWSSTRTHASTAMLDKGVSDVLWESIASIEPAGSEDVFDLRVPGAGNFVADGFVVHNSGALEQDADLVMFLWQKDMQDRKDRVVRLKLAKHRNGPTGDMELLFENELTRFRDLGETRGDA